MTSGWMTRTTYGVVLPLWTNLPRKKKEQDNCWADWTRFSGGQKNRLYCLPGDLGKRQHLLVFLLASWPFFDLLLVHNFTDNLPLCLKGGVDQNIDKMPIIIKTELNLGFYNLYRRYGQHKHKPISKNVHKHIANSFTQKQKQNASRGKISQAG